MSTNDYHFITHWRVQATLREVVEILGDADQLPRWWPSVYLEVKTLTAGDANGVGKRISLYTKGWLPYTLRWQFVVTESNAPHGFTIAAEGDFVGRGIWKFTQDSEDVSIEYDWKIVAEKPILKYLSFIMKPIFSMNHHWAMARGEESLKLELMRRHAKTPEALALVPSPAPATPNNPLRWTLHILRGA